MMMVLVECRFIYQGQFQGVIHYSEECKEMVLLVQKEQAMPVKVMGLGARLNGCGGWISIEKGKHRVRRGGWICGQQ
jgi:hypothetical protein